mmetsp:Transcript_17765/g.22402  ORF Transcript_17765/g.22402 Transcript_17765/m.22402 type:complete len:303 (+) Transcript_17765:78-986(+)
MDELLHFPKLNRAAQFDPNCTIDEVKCRLGYKHVYATDAKGKILHEGRPLCMPSEDVSSVIQLCLSHYPDAVFLFTYNEDTDIISKNGRGNNVFYDFTEACKARLTEYDKAEDKSKYSADFMLEYSKQKGARFFHYHQKHHYPTLHSHLDKSFVNTICNKFRGIRKAMKAKAAKHPLPNPDLANEAEPERHNGSVVNQPPPLPVPSISADAMTTLNQQVPNHDELDNFDLSIDLEFLDGINDWDIFDCVGLPNQENQAAYFDSDPAFPPMGLADVFSSTGTTAQSNVASPFVPSGQGMHDGY